MTTPWLVRVQVAARPGMRLICIPYAGAGASTYRRWRGEFASGVEVLALQTPGRENRLNEAPFSRLESLVAAATAAIRPYLDVPFAVFGHSVGGLVAFELVRRLRMTEGLEAAHLFVSGRRAPQLPPRHPAIAHLPDFEFVREVNRRYGGIPAELLSEPELLSIFLPGLKADMSLFEGYRYLPLEPLACPISAFGGLQDAEATPAELAEWRRQTRGAFTTRTFRGGHFFLQTAHSDVVRGVADDLASSAVWGVRS